MRTKAIFGFGGFASEVYSYLRVKFPDVVHFVHADYYVKGNSKLFSIEDFTPDDFEIIIAVANPKHKKLIVESLPLETQYFTFIHESCILADDNIQIGEGSILCPNCVITTDVILGKHTHLNLGTTIGHNSRVGDYFTSAPAVNISGNCIIDSEVYFGTNSSVRQKINICKNVTIGMGACVTKNIVESGTYVGIPALKIK